MTHVWLPPDEMLTAVRPVPKLLVWVGVVCCEPAPLPSRPFPPLPQHETEPVSRIAQVWSFPAETATAVRPVPRLEVKTGEDSVYHELVAPFPSCPLLPSPQHVTLPSA